MKILSTGEGRKSAELISVPKTTVRRSLCGLRGSSEFHAPLIRPDVMAQKRIADLCRPDRRRGSDAMDDSETDAATHSRGDSLLRISVISLITWPRVCLQARRNWLISRRRDNARGRSEDLRFSASNRQTRDRSLILARARVAITPTACKTHKASCNFAPERFMRRTSCRWQGNAVM